MTRLPLQSTRYNRLQETLAQSLGLGVPGSWRVRSLQILALMAGVYLGANITTYVNDRIPGGRPSAVIVMVLVVELLIRLRSRLIRGQPPLGWVLCDNLRIGAVYSVVLEAFKVGT
jgi:hypothetical protein